MMLKKVYLKEIKTWIILLRAKIICWNFIFKDYEYYGVKWRRNSGIFLTTSILPFPFWVPLSNIIPKSLSTLQFLKFLIVQIKACIQAFQMRYQSFFGHWYPNSYSWFSDSIDVPFVLISTVGHGKLNIDGA